MAHGQGLADHRQQPKHQNLKEYKITTTTIHHKEAKTTHVKFIESISDTLHIYMVLSRLLHNQKVVTIQNRGEHRNS